MLQEFVESISKLAVKADQPKIRKIEAEPPFIYAIEDNGEFEVRRASPMPRDHAASSIQAVCDFARNHAPASEIWFSRAGVVCFLDRTDRRDKVSMPIAATPQRTLLEQWERQSPKLSQAQLILILRTTFARCLGRAGDFIGVVRRVKFVHSQQGEGTITHGKASVGRQIEQEVTGAGVIPEYITLEIPIFANLSFIETVECAVEPDPATSTFALIPLPLEIENAIQRAEMRLYEKIVAEVNTVKENEALVPVYYGKP